MFPQTSSTGTKINAINIPSRTVDYYKLLDIKPTADEETILKAISKETAIAKRNLNDDKLAAIAAASRTLTRLDLRKKYDQKLIENGLRKEEEFKKPEDRVLKEDEIRILAPITLLQPKEPGAEVRTWMNTNFVEGTHYTVEADKDKRSKISRELNELLPAVLEMQTAIPMEARIPETTVPPRRAMNPQLRVLNNYILAQTRVSSEGNVSSLLLSSIEMKYRVYQPQTRETNSELENAA